MCCVLYIVQTHHITNITDTDSNYLNNVNVIQLQNVVREREKKQMLHTYIYIQKQYILLKYDLFLQ